MCISVLNNTGLKSEVPVGGTELFLPWQTRLGEKLFSSISTNVCTVTHPCDTKTNPPPPECRNPPGITNYLRYTPRIYRLSVGGSRFWFRDQSRKSPIKIQLIWIVTRQLYWILIGFFLDWEKSIQLKNWILIFNWINRPQRLGSNPEKIQIIRLRTCFFKKQNIKSRTTQDLNLQMSCRTCM